MSWAAFPQCCSYLCVCSSFSAVLFPLRFFFLLLPPTPLDSVILRLIVVREILVCTGFQRGGTFFSWLNTLYALGGTRGTERCWRVEQSLRQKLSVFALALWSVTKNLHFIVIAAIFPCLSTSMAKSGLRFSIICLFTSLKVSLGDRAEANQCSSVLAWGNPLFSFPSLVFSCAAPSFPRVLTDLIQIANRGKKKSFYFSFLGYFFRMWDEHWWWFLSRSSECLDALSPPAAWCSFVGFLGQCPPESEGGSMSCSVRVLILDQRELLCVAGMWSTVIMVRGKEMRDSMWIGGMEMCLGLA